MEAIKLLDQCAKFVFEKQDAYMMFHPRSVFSNTTMPLHGSARRSFVSLRCPTTCPSPTFSGFWGRTWTRFVPILPPQYHPACRLLPLILQQVRHLRIVHVDSPDRYMVLLDLDSQANRNARLYDEYNTRFYLLIKVFFFLAAER